MDFYSVNLFLRFLKTMRSSVKHLVVEVAMLTGREFKIPYLKLISLGEVCLLFVLLTTKTVCC